MHSWLKGRKIEAGFCLAGDIEMASPMAASLGRPSVDNLAARRSMSVSRHQLSGFMRGTSKDLGALVRDSRHNLSASGHSLPGAEAGSKGMVLPFIPLNLTFSHLNYYVDLPKVCLNTCLQLLQAPWPADMSVHLSFPVL